MTRRHTLYRIATFLNKELNHLARTNFNHQRSTALNVHKQKHSFSLALKTQTQAQRSELKIK
jgi:hypothetical protein